MGWWVLDLSPSLPLSLSPSLPPSLSPSLPPSLPLVYFISFFLSSLSRLPLFHSVSERSSADTLYRTKLKLDLIQERVKALERETDRASSSEPPLSALSSLSLGSSHPASLKLDPKLERVEALGRETDRASSSEPPQSSVSLRPSLPASLSPPPLQVFSSLEDWHTTAVAEDRARLLEVERAVSLCCRDVLLPLACQTPPQSKCVVHRTVVHVMILAVAGLLWFAVRNVCNLFNLSFFLNNASFRRYRLGTTLLLYSQRAYGN